MTPLRTFAAVLLGALALVPGATATLSVTYTVTSGTAGDNGWYLTDVTASIQTTGATDTTCPSVKTFRSSSDTLDCTATDGSGTFNFHLQFKIDKDAPTVTGASPDRQPNANGWFNAPVTVTLAGSDATSGIASCQQPSYSGGDSATATVSGTCRDGAGNVSAPFSFGLKYDASPPIVSATPGRSPDSNGWYNHQVTVSFSGADPVSGIGSCTAPATYGTDSPAATVSGTCTDKAGNTAGGSVTLAYDSTAPAATVTLARAADSNGWYNHSVAANATGSDTGSGLAGCSAGSYSGQADSNASITGTCTDRAGNAGSNSVSFKYDATPPTVSTSPGRSPDGGGWYNHPVTVSFAGSDPASGIDSCTTPTSYGGPDNSAATVSGSCTDKAGNTAGGSFTLAYDSTAPTATVTLARAADSNGWYNHTIAATASGSDTGSGLAACSAGSYSGPADSNASLTGTCTDKAGNTTSKSVIFKYDATPPSVSASPARSADSGGWYNHPVTVSFSGTDPVSGIDSCTAPAGYSGPDTSGATVAGNCTDKAGNTGTGSLSLKYDATPPTATVTLVRAPDSNGWYNHPLGANATGSDSGSGLAACSADIYSGPADSNASLTGSCIDMAGNSTSKSVIFKYDATPPSVSASPARSADSGGWYNHPVTVSFSGTDPVSGIDSCTAPAGYSGPDTSGATVAGNCTDKAGNTGTGSLSLKYDATPPTATVTLVRAPDSNGWYNHPLGANATGSDSGSGLAACSADIYSGPADSNASLTGSCIDMAGNSTSKSVIFKYDATPPSMSASPARSADSGGWYNHPVTVSFSGTDPVSGIDSCTAPAGYSGPDTSGATVAGNCTDKAGNTGTGSFSLQYDATPPTASATPGRSPDSNGWYNHPVSVSFTGADPASGIGSCTSSSYSGPDSSAATVTGSCTDKAGNTAGGSFALEYDATPPTATVTLARTPDSNGWYNHPVAATATGADTGSGLAGCSAGTYAGPADSNASLTGTCTDKAGNSTSNSVALKYDATPPSVTASPARGADAAGWYNHPVTISFTGTDANSGIDSCSAPSSYGGPDSSAATATGSCTDKAGNTTSSTFSLQYDSIPPTAAVTLARAADSNGWYNHAVAATASGTDSGSGLAGCSAGTYGGPADGNASITGTCTDKAGNTASKSVTFKYDATPPSVSASPGRSSDANGWYNHALTVSFAGTDPTSGIDTCTAPASYGGPDTSATTFSGTCSDKAGNTASASFTLGYDSTPPSATVALARAPDSNGWYNHPVAAAASGTDSGSGIDDCTAPTYNGAADDNAALTGTCTDKAGNSASKSVAFKYDATPPTVNTSPGRGPDTGGWYNHPVTVSFSGTDPASGIDSCAGPASYSGPDNSAATVSGTCTDKAGNTGSGGFSLQYDETPPAVGASPARGPDANGWYNHPVSVSFSGSDSASGVDSCSSGSYSGPDTSSATVSGTCTDKAGNTGGGGLSLQYDATAPSTTLALARPPDANGWYNHPVAATAGGSDSGSGIAGCSAGTYSGAAGDSSSLTGTCTDNAGNTATSSVTFKYDATPPELGDVTAAGANGKVTLRWTISSGASVTVTRIPTAKTGDAKTVYRGAGGSFTDTKLTNGLRYRYSLSAVDEAGNEATATATATPLALSGPPQGTKLEAPPTLRWAKVNGASYYNVQLFLQRKKILSIWPLVTAVKLPSSWTFDGKKHKLVPGTYRWYVWPGFGKRKASKYGKLLGGSTFVVGSQSKGLRS